MTPEDIARYLATHPEFFDQFPHLLTDVRVSHPYEGRAIPIAERQILNLREKVSLLELRLSEFVRFGEENDLTSQRLHALALDLISATDLPELLAALYFHLREDFGLPHAAVRLWDIDQNLTECAPCDQGVIDWANAMPYPQCGAWLHPDALCWLGESAAERSYAAVPLRHLRTYGVLVLAADDSKRFYPEMGTIYLQRLGQMTAAALARLFPELPPGV